MKKNSRRKELHSVLHPFLCPFPKRFPSSIIMLPLCFITPLDLLSSVLFSRPHSMLGCFSYSFYLHLSLCVQSVFERLSERNLARYFCVYIFVLVFRFSFVSDKCILPKYQAAVFLYSCHCCYLFIACFLSFFFPLSVIVFFF